MNPREQKPEKAADDNEFSGPQYGGHGRDPEDGDIAEDAPPARDSDGFGAPLFGGHGLDTEGPLEPIEDEAEAIEMRGVDGVRGPRAPHSEG